MENLGKTRFSPNPSPHTRKYLNLKDFIKSQNEISGARAAEAEAVGASEAFVRQKALEKKYQKKNLE